MTCWPFWKTVENRGFGTTLARKRVDLLSTGRERELDHAWDSEESAALGIGFHEKTQWANYDVAEHADLISQRRNRSILGYSLTADCG